MLYRCEGNLCANLVVKIIEHVTVKVFGVVNCDLLQDYIAIDNILPEKLFDGCGGYVGDGLGLNPFCEVFHCHDGKGIISLRWGEFVDYVDALALQRQRWGDQL
jgi:hypothetical protein